MPTRRSGTTTRIVDRCIQELFKNGITYVYDGRGTHSAKQQTDEVFNIFLQRIRFEHKYAITISDRGTYDGIYAYKVVLQKK